MDTQDIINHVNQWGKTKPTTEYLDWARGYYTNLYSWQRWWCISQLPTNQKGQVWQRERDIERPCTPAELCNKFNLKFEPADISRAPQWRYTIGHYIGLMDTLNQELSDYENYHVIDKLLMLK